MGELPGETLMDATGWNAVIDNIGLWIVGLIFLGIMLGFFDK